MKRANICCGTEVLSGWDNFDKYPCDERVRYLDLDSIPYFIRNDTYDVVMVKHGLEHTSVNQLDVLRELRRITKPGGRVVVEAPVFSPMVCHTSVYHPVTYFNVVSKKKRVVNCNYTGNWFKPVGFEYVGKRSLKTMLFWMKTRFLSWVNSFRFDSSVWYFEVNE